MNMDLSMSSEDGSFIKKIEWNMIFVVMAIQLIGLIALFSATHGPNTQDMEPLFFNQLLWLGVGWVIFFILTFIDYNLLNRFILIIYFINLAALAFTIVYGKIALGAQRWIDLGIFHYQPSETMKLSLILALSKYLSFYSVEGKGLGTKELFIPMLMILFPFMLVVKQPDLGTALMIVGICGTMIYFMKVRTQILLFVFLSIAIAAPLVWKYGMKDYQKARITNFLSPHQDPRGAGYNSIQSKIAVGSGRWVGKGFRKGTQTQLEFLPERHTDFIFSVLSEEHGFFGSLSVITLFSLLFLIMVRIATTARDKWGSLLSVGVLAYLFWHMFINIGMVIGILPIVGVPLPLISYGGSSMLTTMIGLGLISSVAYRRFLF